MPITPRSHEARQRHPYVRDAETYRAYACHRKAIHGPDPRMTQRWRRVRALVLQRNPLCADPYDTHGGQIVPATEVDHRLGIWEHPELRWTLSNLQPLCWACHGRKSARERGQTGGVSKV